MSPCNIISELRLGLVQKVELAFLMLGFKSVARIDIYSGNDSPTTIKIALLQVGWKFSTLNTSGKEKHLCGLAVAVERGLTIDFKDANQRNDQDTVMKLSGEEIAFPLSIGNPAVIQIRQRIPTLYDELVKENAIAA